MNISDIINLMNYTFVLFFGIIVAFYLADLPFEEHHRLYVLTLLGFSALQLVLPISWLAIQSCSALSKTILASSLSRSFSAT